MRFWWDIRVRCCGTPADVLLCYINGEYLKSPEAAWKVFVRTSNLKWGDIDGVFLALWEHVICGKIPGNKSGFAKEYSVLVCPEVCQ